MSKNPPNPKVDEFLRRATPWREEMTALRKIILGCGLTEELKWSKPCYTFQGSNVVIVQAFKASCTLLFCKGVLLKDSAGLLLKPGENTQSARVLRFTSVDEIAKQKTILVGYIKEAIAAEEAGHEVKFKTIAEFSVPVELQNRLAASSALKKAFTALTPGRQRGYLMHIAGAKQAATRESRLDKCVPRILAGQGLHD